ncbi:RidA family protein [uncultured Paludibaculum sp.]|uniref:RidA family protein n=1 Tax=uncultured Paludibaculum sp. TaxID=1765020 RepID=UPI002AABBC95|nr:RidA family protein [uncultured Paludibaculum sp.]
MRTLFLLIFVAAGSLVLSAADKVAVVPDGASASGPFSPGIQAGGTLYCSGQTGRTKDGKTPEAFEDEVKAALDAGNEILKKAGYSVEDVVAVQVYLTDMELFSRMNAVYTKFFPQPRPARTTVGVAKLVGTSRIEITFTAWKRQAR